MHIANDDMNGIMGRRTISDKETKTMFAAGGNCKNDFLSLDVHFVSAPPACPCLSHHYITARSVETPVSAPSNRESREILQRHCWSTVRFT